MDFLDPKKQKAHRIRLLVGYVLIGLALAIATTILLYQTYGFGINDGKIVQDGLVFVSSQPGGADILVNGELKAQTNTRLNLPAGQYTFKIRRDGYRSWQRSIGVEGGSVEHFDYPFLVPTALKSTSYAKYTAKPDAVLQSPDRRWLLVAQPGVFGSFDVYDLAHPKNAAATLALPGGAFTPTSGTQAWQLVDWSNDNTHVLLRHIFTPAAGQQTSEYVLVNRANPQQSVNLSAALGQTPTDVAFKNGAYDQYYVFNAAAGTLATVSLNTPAPVAIAQHVAAFTAANSNTVMYVSNAPIASGANVGKVSVVLRQGNSTYTLGHLAQVSSYLLRIQQYNGDWYAAFAASTDAKVAVYENPVAQLTSGESAVLVPTAVLKVADPTTLAFSVGNQFLMAQNGSALATFDAQTDKSYTYSLPASLGTLSSAATWTDSAHLAVNAGGKVVLLDFDGANRQTLVAADISAPPLFDPSYRTLYTLQQSSAAYVLNATSMLTPADQ